MKTEIIKLSDITPAEYNPRKPLKPGDKEYEALKNSLERFGVAQPLVINGRTGKLVSGHQRLNALTAMGVKEVETVVVDLDEDQEKLLNIAMNKIEGEWDYDKLEALFSEVDKEDVKFTGFDEEELDSLFGRDDPEPEFGEDEDNTGAGTKKKTKTARERFDDEEEPEQEFSVYMSFATKDQAERWMRDRGIDAEFPGVSRAVVVRMEG